ncbi:oxidoreductase [Xylaria venustula]|nr:oxidoreductase [Xylaria venustula]
MYVGRMYQPPALPAPLSPIVIGTGSRIGLESALIFAERGARAQAYRNSRWIRDRNSVRRMIKDVKAKFGRLDYAVNCVGVPRQVAADTVAVDESEYDHLHDINAKGILHCPQEEIRGMKYQEPLFAGRRKIGPGAIINITSLSALIGTAQSTTYVSSKFAARGIIKCAALENRTSGLRINEVCPGFTNTPMLQRGIQEQPAIGEILDKSMPLGRVAVPEEIANAIYFLASPGASFITGQSIVVDSGVSVNVLT